MESVSPSFIPTGTRTATYLFDQDPLVTGKSGGNGTGVRTASLVDITPYNQFARLDPTFAQTLDLSSDGSHNLSNWSYDQQGELFNHYFGDEHYNQALLWDSFGRLVRVEQTFNATNNYTWKTVYDGLGRRIQTTCKGSTVNYYYDPQVEYMELGHSFNGSRTWNLFGPDRSGRYGGAQGIGGLEAEYDQNSGGSYGVVNNYFGDTLGLVGSGGFTPYKSVLGAYGAMPGSEEVNQNLQPQWRGHYQDWTGFYSMGARYYEPKSGRFLSADPLGHGSSLSLYDYCGGDPVNGLDPDGRDAVSDGKGGYYFVMRQDLDPEFLKDSKVTNLSDRYSGQCATGAQFLSGTVMNGVVHDAPSTRTWRQGPSVDKSTPLGTMIATGWQDGKYPSAPPSAYQPGGSLHGSTMNHTGIFMGTAPDGQVQVFDQYTGKALDNQKYPANNWSLVSSDQKYDLRPSDSALRPPEDNLNPPPKENPPIQRGCGR